MHVERGGRCAPQSAISAVDMKSGDEWRLIARQPKRLSEA